jgi:hypothetical protein
MRHRTASRSASKKTIIQSPVILASLPMANQLTDTHLLLITAGVTSTPRDDSSRRMGSVCVALGPMACSCKRIYAPFELYELYECVTWLSLGALTLNLAIVAFMLYRLFHIDGKKIANAS